MTQLTYRRGKRRIIADYTSHEIYKFYKERYGESALPKKMVMKIYSKLFPSIVKMMVFENFDYRLPSRLGYLRVKKKEVGPKLDESGNLDTRRLSINWKATKKLWQKLFPDKNKEELKLIKNKPLVRELNEYNGGFRLTWFWDKTTCNIRNQNAYYVDLSRDNDQILSKGAKTNDLNFYE